MTRSRPVPPPGWGQKNVRAVVPLGIFVNPKNGAIVYSGTSEALSLDWKEIIVLTAAGEYVGTGFMNKSDYPASFRLTGYPRIHTSPGISDRFLGGGYGTTLYTALCHAVEMQRVGRVVLPQVVLNNPDAGISSVDLGTRSEEASGWWASAIQKYGIASEEKKNLKLCVAYLPGWKTLPDRVRRPEALDAALDQSDIYEISRRINWENGDRDVKINFNNKTKIARVELVDIPVDIYRYKDAKQFVMASIIPHDGRMNGRHFRTLEEVPPEWIVPNVEVMLAADVGQLSELGDYGAILCQSLVKSLVRAKVRGSEISDFIERYDRGFNVSITPEMSRAAPGAVHGAGAADAGLPDRFAVEMVSYKGSQTETARDVALAEKLAQRRLRLGWWRF